MYRWAAYIYIIEAEEEPKRVTLAAEGEGVVEIPDSQPRQ